jgi:outer membrane protein assembly factor BamB
MPCGMCEAERATNARFCGACGARLDPLAPAASATMTTSEPEPAMAAHAGAGIAGDASSTAPVTSFPGTVSPAPPGQAVPAPPTTALPTAPPPPNAPDDESLLGAAHALRDLVAPVPSAPPPPSSDAAAPPPPILDAPKAKAPLALLLIVAAAFTVVALVAAGTVAFRTLRRPATWREAYSTAPQTEAPLYGPLRAEPQERWSFEAAEPVTQSLVIGDRAFLLQGDDSSAYLTAVSLSDGAQLGEQELDKSFTRGALTHVGGQVLAMSYEGKVAAFDPDTYEKRWEKEYEGVTGPLGARGDLIVLVSGSSGHLSDIIAVHGASGERAWGKGVTASSVSLGATNVYIAEDEQITAYNAGSGDKRWTVSTDTGAVFNEIGDVLLVSTNADPGRVRAYDTADGTRVWDASVRDDQITEIGLLDDGTALLRTADRTTAIDVTDKGVEKWSTKALVDPGLLTGRSTQLVGAVADGSSSSSSGERVLVVDVAKGDQVVSITTKSSSSSSQLADGVMYGYESSDRKVVAYDLQTGERLWRYSIPAPSGSTTPSVEVSPTDGGLLVVNGPKVTLLGD